MHPQSGSTINSVQYAPRARDYGCDYARDYDDVRDYVCDYACGYACDDARTLVFLRWKGV